MRPRSRNLRFELLESRWLHAVFSVSNLEDSGVGSLRSAIELANLSNTPDEIWFSVTGTIDITSQLPTITDDLAITGPGAKLLTIDAGNGADNAVSTSDGWRVFNIDDGEEHNQITVSIAAISFVGGDPSSIDNRGFGGAILNREDFRLYNCEFSSNFSELGGAIFNYGKISISTCAFANNKSDFGGALCNDGLAYVTDSYFAGNSVSNDGGAIFNSGSANIDRTTFTNNSTSLDDGGAVCNEGTLSIAASTFNDNLAAGSGGGVHNSLLLIIESSSLFGNSANTRGGAISNTGVASVTISTISGNEAVNDEGGGIYSNGELSISQSSITVNTAGIRGGGVSAYGADIKSSIVAGNSAAENPNVSCSIDTSLFNLLDGDPLLGPLSNNGGFTLTHALLPGSPALDASDPDLRTPPFVDQRGQVRWAVTRMDIGSYEAQLLPSADFDYDDDTDGRDFLAWQRGYGTLNLFRQDGNSDDDMDVDASDLAAWQVSYGTTEDILMASDAPLIAEKYFGELADAGTAVPGLYLVADESNDSNDSQIAGKEPYIEEVDRALEKFVAVPSGVREFGEMVARRGVSESCAMRTLGRVLD